jgi:hypothetical protein
MLDCTIESCQGGFAVYEKDPQVRITEFTPRGVSVAILPAATVFKTRFSLFTAYYKGDKQWDTDEHAGAQRFCTTRSTTEIRKALKKCGFDKDTIDKTIKQAKGKCK